jgi:hypothetical protein
MSGLYILGGKQRRLGMEEPTERDEWCLYDTAIILELDTQSGSVRTCVEYQSPFDARAGSHAAASFHGGALIGNLLYTCTTTEVLIFRLPTFERVGYVSLPCFNDLHHVTRCSDGNLLIVNTGLEMVLKVTPQGERLKEWSVLGEDTWSRFSRQIDYRKVESTKPHRSHPNFAFELDGEIWATRFHQRDAVCLTRWGKRIAIGGEFPHDGLVWGDRILFTAVDGKIVIVNRHSLGVEQSVDLRQIRDRDQQTLPAWCRGLLPVDERRIWVGFTRIRKTLFREHVRWIKTILGEGTVVMPTHVALFDIVDKKCLMQFDLEPYRMNTIFAIFPVPDPAMDGLLCTSSQQHRLDGLEHD